MAAQVVITLADLETAVPLDRALEARPASRRAGGVARRRARRRSASDHPALLVLTGAVHERRGARARRRTPAITMWRVLALLGADRLRAHRARRAPRRPPKCWSSRWPWTNSSPPSAGWSSAASCSGAPASSATARRSRKCSSRSSRWRRYRAPCSSRASRAPARSWSRGRSTTSRRGAAGRSSPSTAPRCRRRCSKANSSATRRARSPAPPNAGSAASSWPTPARSFSTRSARSRPACRSSCCACWRRARSSGVGGVQPIKVDVRVVAATNRSLKDRVAARRVPRRSLLPTQRAVDLPAAAARAARRHSAARSSGSSASSPLQHDRPFPGIAADAMQRLVQAPWPGNVRQLRNLIESMVVLAPAKRDPGGRHSRRMSWRAAGTLLPMRVPTTAWSGPAQRRHGGGAEFEFILRALMELRVAARGPPAAARGSRPRKST